MSKMSENREDSMQVSSTKLASGTGRDSLPCSLPDGEYTTGALEARNPKVQAALNKALAVPSAPTDNNGGEAVAQNAPTNDAPDGKIPNAN